MVSPGALGPVATDPARSDDRLSASYLIALSARAVREVGELWRMARTKNKRLATLSIDTAIQFRSPADRAAFTEELSDIGDVAGGALPRRIRFRQPQLPLGGRGLSEAEGGCVMPMKRDDSGRRWVEMEFLVPGTPEQVWQAIATGPGMSAWFTTRRSRSAGGDRFETPDGTPRLAGRVERIHQDAVSRAR